MYRILVDTADPNKPVCLFDDRLIDQRVKVVDPVLELEDNASGSLEFTVYSTNQGYGTPDGETDDLLVVSSATLRVYQDSEEIWEGRPLTIDTDFWNGKKITCEGALSYLNDVDQPYKEYANSDGSRLEIIDFINGVLTEYNAKASPNRRFNTEGTYVNPIKIPRTYHYTDEQHVATESDLPQSGVSDMTLYHVDTSDTYWLWYDSKWNDVTSGVHLDLGYRRATGGETTRDSIFALVDDEQYGGHIKVVTDAQGRRCLFYTLAFDPEDYFINGGRTVSKPVQPIKFGKNLLDLTKTRDSTDFFTVLLPVGAEISASNPDTIESMCEDVINNPSSGHPLYISDNGVDAIIDTRVAPYDATSVLGRMDTGYSRRVFTVDLYDGNGYDYFLFTSAHYRTDDQGMPDLGFYILGDNSAQSNRIASTYGIGYATQSGDYDVRFDNKRMLQAKSLGKVAYSRQVINGDRIVVPETGRGTLAFSVDMDYAWATSKSDGGRASLPTSIPDVGAFLAANTINYPKLYKSPYPRQTFIDTGLIPVPDSDIRWTGIRRDRHWENDINNQPYASYGGDDNDIVVEGDGTVRTTDSNDKSAHYLDRYPPFGTPNLPHSGVALPYPWDLHDYGATYPDWMFLTGFFGHHVARVQVEPGKTYYLNTRVTNPGYPDFSMYTMDPNVPASEVPESQWVFDTSGTPKKRIYNDIFAYAVVARRWIRDKVSDYGSYRYEVVSYKLANKSNITTELQMEEIVIPRALIPERKASFNEQSLDDVYHMELWFTCDSCYINGSANLSDNRDTRDGDTVNPTNGYHPSIYMKEKTLDLDEATQRDYHQCVTIAPLNQQQPTGYENFPREYFVNKELADKYGVIVKRIDFETAVTPTQLMFFTEQAMSLMTGEPSFEVSAVDLKACGLEDCDKLRLMQRIPIETTEHGVDTLVSLSQMSINLADLSSNTYTFGYEANKGISQM